MSGSIEATSLKKTFKEIKAVDGLNLKIKGGEFVALLGPNGAGKSTLIEMLEGIQRPDSGSIRIDGKSWEEDAGYLRNIVGISLQETRFMDKVTVRETLRLFASFYKAETSMVPEVLKMTGLKEKQNSFVVNLSGGQRQKLALAISLINKPKILFLDEPTTGLDPGARREIWSILEDMRTGGTTLLLTTHYMEEAEYLCERILIMYSGKIIASGTLEELLGQYGVSQTVELELDRAPAKNWLSGVSQVEDETWKEAENKVLIRSKDVAKLLPLLFPLLEKSSLSLKSIQCRSMTLDDLFILLTGTYLHE